ncbi:MAG: hypothetical protein GY835_22535 [bacterium]|nr:hypothetical protein [bacterium]
MAVKSKAQVLALLQETVELLDDTRTYMAGEFTTNLEAVNTAIDGGDTEPEDQNQVDAVEGVREAGEGLMAAIRLLFKAIVPTLGRYASSPDLFSEPINIAAFSDKLDSDSEAVLSANYSKFTSFTMSGSGNGADGGTVFVHNTDPDGIQADISAVETLTLKCTKDESHSGIVSGAEEWTLEGGAEADHSWLWPGGSGRSGGGQHRDADLSALNYTTNRFHPAQPVLLVGGTLQCTSASANRNNKVLNGGFTRSFGSGTTDKINDWTLSGDHALVLAEETVVMRGDQCAVITAGANGDETTVTFTQTLLTRVHSGVAYGLQGWGRIGANIDDAAGGSITLKIKDADTDHLTLTIANVGAWTDDTWTKFATASNTVIIPASAKDLSVEIVVTDLQHDGTLDYLYLDEIQIVELKRTDGGRAIGIAAGSVDWSLDSKGTGATTGGTTGKIQQAFVECCDTYIKHAGSAVYWSDPA